MITFLLICNIIHVYSSIDTLVAILDNHTRFLALQHWWWLIPEWSLFVIRAALTGWLVDLSVSTVLVRYRWSGIWGNLITKQIASKSIWSDVHIILRPHLRSILWLGWKGVSQLENGLGHCSNNMYTYMAAIHINYMLGWHWWDNAYGREDGTKPCRRITQSMAGAGWELWKGDRRAAAEGTGMGVAGTMRHVDSGRDVEWWLLQPPLWRRCGKIVTTTISSLKDSRISTGCPHPQEEECHKIQRPMIEPTMAKLHMEKSMQHNAYYLDQYKPPQGNWIRSPLWCPRSNKGITPGQTIRSAQNWQQHQ